MVRQVITLFLNGRGSDASHSAWKTIVYAEHGLNVNGELRQSTRIHDYADFHGFGKGKSAVLNELSSGAHTTRSVVLPLEYEDKKRFEVLPSEGEDVQEILNDFRAQIEKCDAVDRVQVLSCPSNGLSSSYIYSLLPQLASTANIEMVVKSDDEKKLSLLDRYNEMSCLSVVDEFSNSIVHMQETHLRRASAHKFGRHVRQEDGVNLIVAAVLASTTSHLRFPTGFGRPLDEMLGNIGAMGTLKYLSCAMNLHVDDRTGESYTMFKSAVESSLYRTRESCQSLFGHHGRSLGSYSIVRGRNVFDLCRDTCQSGTVFCVSGGHPILAHDSVLIVHNDTSVGHAMRRKIDVIGRSLKRGEECYHHFDTENLHASLECGKQIASLYEEAETEHDDEKEAEESRHSRRKDWLSRRKFGRGQHGLRGYGGVVVVLDIDDTLLKCLPTPDDDLEPDFRMFHSDGSSRCMYLRPKLRRFLRWLENQPNLVVGVWTNAGGAYARCALRNALGELIRVVEFVWDNRHSKECGKKKNLRTLSESLSVPVSRIVMIDDKSTNFPNSRQAVKIIKKFCNPSAQRNDEELHRMKREIKKKLRKLGL